MTEERIDKAQPATLQEGVETLRSRLGEIAKRCPTIGDVRGLGLMTGATVLDKAGQPSQELRNAVAQEAFKRGLILLGCGDTSLRFAPPLCITEQQISTGLGIIEEALAAVSV